MESQKIIEVIQKLVGNVNPAGAAHLDDERLKNLQTLIEVGEAVVNMIGDVAINNRKYPEGSIRKAVDLADKFMNRLIALNENDEKVYPESYVKEKVLVFLHLKSRAMGDDHVYPADYREWIDKNFDKTLKDL